MCGSATWEAVCRKHAASFAFAKDDPYRFKLVGGSGAAAVSHTVTTPLLLTLTIGEIASGPL